MPSNYRVYPESIDNSSKDLKNTSKKIQNPRNKNVKSVSDNNYDNESEISTDNSYSKYNPTSIVNNDQIYNDYVSVNPLKNTTILSKRKNNNSTSDGTSSNLSSDNFNSAIQIHRLNRKNIHNNKISASNKENNNGKSNNKNINHSVHNKNKSGKTTRDNKDDKEESKIDNTNIYSNKQRYSPRKHRIEREALKQFESIVNYGDINTKALNNSFSVNDASFKLTIKKGCQQHGDPTLSKHTIYVNNTLPNHNNTTITVNISENGNGIENSHGRYSPSRSPTFHQHLDFDKENQSLHDSNLKTYDPMYLQDGNLIDLSEFKTYLINYGKKYGVQQLKKVLHEQFYKRIKIISNDDDNNKSNAADTSKNNEMTGDDNGTENTSRENLFENTSEFSMTSTDLLKELEKEIESSISGNGDTSLNPNEVIIARCTSFTETDVPYLEPNIDRNPEMLTLQKNNYIPPPPSTLVLQCCPSPKQKKKSTDKSSSRYHPQFDRKAKEQFLKKKFKNVHINGSIDFSRIKSYNEEEDEEESSNYDDDEDEKEESDEYEDIDSSYSSNSDDMVRNNLSTIGPNEIMNYKVEMYNNKRKFFIEKNKAKEKVKEGEEEYPVFKDFLYPRWYQHQRYYTNENGVKGLNGLYGNLVVDDEDEDEEIKDVYIDNKTLKKIIEKKSSKERCASINDDDNDDDDYQSNDYFNLDPKEQILKEIEVVKQDLINLRKKNKLLWNGSHPRQNDFHYPTRDESIRYWSWKNRHPENAAILFYKRQNFKIQYEQKIRKMKRLFELIKVLRQPDYININKIRNEERYYKRKDIKPKSPPPFSVNGKKYIHYEPVQFLSSPNNDEKVEKKEEEPKKKSKSKLCVKSKYVRMNFSNVQPKKINWGFHHHNNKNKKDNNKLKSDTESRTNDKFYTLFDTDVGVKEAFQNLIWKNNVNEKDLYEPSKKFKKLFGIDSDPEKNTTLDNNNVTAANTKTNTKNTTTTTTITTTTANNNNDNENSNDNKRVSNYTKLRDKEIYDNSMATHASVTGVEIKECLPVNNKGSKNSQYKSRCSTRSLKSIKSLSSLGASSNHIYDYKKLNDPNYLENLKFKYRHDPVGKKTLLELLRGTYIRNIGDDDDNGLFYNKNNHITYSRSRRSSMSGSRRSSVAESIQSTSSRRSSLAESLVADPSSSVRIPGVDKSPLEEDIDEFARKKGRFLNIDQMKEVLQEEKMKMNKLDHSHKALASKSIMRKVNIVDKDSPSGNSRRKHFYKQLERMNDRYNASIYAMFNI